MSARREMRGRLAGLVLLVCLGVTAGAVAATATSVRSSQNSVLGKILVSSAGRTLYHNALETKGAVRCTGSCSTNWPPLVVSAGVKPVAGTGVTSALLATVTRPDGKVQVTYKGMPLYLYSGDHKADDVAGQGEGGVWHAISAPSGTVVTKAASASSSSKSSTSSGSKSSSSGASAGSGSSSSGGSSSGGGSSIPSDCDKNPGGYGCM
ncbi:MAG: hypothetical protein WCH31_09745 [Actinomycetes bacterium]